MISNKKYLYTVIGIIYFLGLFGYALYRESKIKKEVNRMTKKYPPIILSENINGEISKIIDYKSNIVNNNPNHVFVVINDSLYRSIIVGLELRSNNNIDNVISVGDLIKKGAGENMIEMYRLSKIGDSSKFIYQLSDEKGNLIRKMQ